ncbi:hypothetical protein [Microbacterium sp. 13-71-7]|jgi:oligoribonuclease (3'-5' exoribonuclease)|uniref:hypothetical protein n=1 Tax=Microbacterium sp. 13-71-7 TaxID=1970399 RepID=UPI000BD48244|nr:hypothetical protein [Microbacterium sp. 13-71-7]OZB85401.1 MAG: hypothetical protein B7X32_03670 [Microbacterium sp. 13-71-7]
MSTLTLMLDVETPGVSADPHFRPDDRILEVAVILVDEELTELGRFETLVEPRRHDMARIATTPVVYEMHRKSGLLAELVSGRGHLPSMEDAENGILAVIDEHAGPDSTICLGGSGVARYDHPIIETQMPRLAARLAYWEQDVSSARRHYMQVTGQPLVPPLPTKAHRAMLDIEDDLRHMRALRDIYRAAQLTTSDPVARVLTATRLAEAFHSHDSFITADGVELVTTDTAEVVRSLLHGSSPLDVAAGFMDVVEQLAAQVAAQKGTTVPDVLDGIRRQALSIRA